MLREHQSEGPLPFVSRQFRSSFDGCQQPEEAQCSRLRLAYLDTLSGEQGLSRGPLSAAGWSSMIADGLQGAEAGEAGEAGDFSTLVENLQGVTQCDRLVPLCRPPLCCAALWRFTSFSSMESCLSTWGKEVPQLGGSWGHFAAVPSHVFFVKLSSLSAARPNDTSGLLSFAPFVSLPAHIAVGGDLWHDQGSCGLPMHHAREYHTRSSSARRSACEQETKPGPSRSSGGIRLS
ncbi:hypothetical protein B0T16DRAFT_201154 [Cercophora newfieldiana]|uniref:Uncharacterized protein n=1 Tax=Cercophora newfieldiana TaxID=92897 RepID=A0AA40CKS2_9PEZI|nr:hypothetical protein B0T16DRAFT_201154 [Cercophora newfieldiana]